METGPYSRAPIARSSSSHTPLRSPLVPLPSSTAGTLAALLSLLAIVSVPVVVARTQRSDDHRASGGGGIDAPVGTAKHRPHACELDIISPPCKVLVRVGSTRDDQEPGVTTSPVLSTHRNTSLANHRSPVVRIGSSPSCAGALWEALTRDHLGHNLRLQLFFWRPAVAPLAVIMPASFDAPLLTVDLEQMHRIDTRSAEDLFGLWTVFNRCSNSLDQGYRYENMSWRLWGRQVPSVGGLSKRTQSSMHADRTPRQSTKDLPQLSSSVDSASSEEYECVDSDPARSSPVTITGSASPAFEHVNGSGRLRARPSSGALGRMVLSIKETKIQQRGEMPGLAPAVTAAIRPVLKASDVLPSSQTSASERRVPLKQTGPRPSQSSAASTLPLSSPESSIARSNTCGSETSAEFISTPDVVRGFTPTSISSHRTSLASPQPDPVPIKSSLRPQPDPTAAKQAKFMLGGSSEEESSSLEDQMSLRKPGMIAPTHAPKDTSTVKQASFNDNVQTRLVPNEADEDAIATDDEDEDDVDESAIEEEDGSDEEEWDDYSDAEDPPPPPQFGRIDSSTRLTSRRSLLTTGLHQSEREHAMLGMATTNAAVQAAEKRRERQASSNGPSVGASDDEQPMEMQGIKITRTKPPLGSNSALQHPPALSPRTTRRNMLATELTESLRKHLLWERQQKNTTANAHLRRRHTAHDMANLHQYPEGASPEDSGSRNNSWNSVFDTGLGEYHSRGW